MMKLCVEVHGHGIHFIPKIYAEWEPSAKTSSHILPRAMKSTKLIMGGLPITYKLCKFHSYQSLFLLNLLNVIYS